MKKTISILVIAILMLVLGMGAVNAVTDFKVSLTANNVRVDQGATVVITVNLKDFKANETGIDTLKGTLDYDKTVFETVTSADIVGQNGWAGLTYNQNNGEFVLQNSTFISENHEFIKVTFKAKANATIGNTTVSLKDMNASDGVSDIFPTDQQITLTIKEASGNVNNNNIINNNTTNNNNIVNNTNSNTNTMPNTGVEDYILPSILIIAVIAIFAYVKYTRIDK